MKKVYIKGAIIPNDDQWIYDWLDWEATSPKSVQKQLENTNGDDIEVEINSGGGSVYDASEIYTSLKEHPGKVTTKIVGLAASAASVVAMAGDHLMMSPTSQMMIHNASAYTNGDYRDMQHMSEILKNVNQTVANAYKLKSNLSDAKLLELMNNETWFTPQQALDHGLIDEIMFEKVEPVIMTASYNNGLIPQKVIEKIKNSQFENLICPQDKSDFLLAQTTKLNYLKLGGHTNE